MLTYLETSSFGCIHECESGAQVRQVPNGRAFPPRNAAKLPEEHPQEREHTLGNEQGCNHNMAPRVDLEDTWPLYPLDE
jgi:hypothetical protein